MSFMIVTVLINKKHRFVILNSGSRIVAGDGDIVLQRVIICNCTFERTFKTRSYSLTWDGDFTGKENRIVIEREDDNGFKLQIKQLFL